MCTNQYIRDKLSQSAASPPLDGFELIISTRPRLSQSAELKTAQSVTKRQLTRLILNNSEQKDDDKYPERQTNNQKTDK